MKVKRYGLVDGIGKVTNVIELDPQQDYIPPSGLILVEVFSGDELKCDVGGTWSPGAGFIRPPDPPAPKKDKARALLDALIAKGVITQAEIDAELGR